MEIIEFLNKYKEETIQLLIDVAVHEFGFPEWKEELLKFENEFFKDNNGNCWLAIDDDKVVGTISLRKIGDNRGEVKNLYVHSEYRNKKIAQTLLDVLVEYAGKNKYSVLQLDTYDKFSAAISFYKKNGFERIDTIEGKHIYEKAI